MKGHSMKTTSIQVSLRLARTLALLCAPLAAGCFQPIDEGSTKGTIDQTNQAAIPPPEGPVTTTFQPEEPAGSLTNGETAAAGSGCGVTNEQAMDVLNTGCGGCHTGDVPQSGIMGFDILNVASMKTGMAIGQIFTGKDLRYLIPGDPAKSLIYYRTAIDHSMPKAANGIEVRPPTPSDASLLYTWIKTCIGADPMPGKGADPAAATSAQ